MSELQYKSGYITGYHVTFKGNVESIIQYGFEPSEDGTVGAGVYLFSCGTEEAIRQAMWHTEQMFEGMTFNFEDGYDPVETETALLFVEYEGDYIVVDEYIVCCLDAPSGFISVEEVENWVDEWRRLIARDVDTLWNNIG